MCTVSCENHRPRGTKHVYVLGVAPAHSNVLKCGRNQTGCRTEGVVWLNQAEAADYSAGARDFVLSNSWVVVSTGNQVWPAAGADTDAPTVGPPGDLGKAILAVLSPDKVLGHVAIMRAIFPHAQTADYHAVGAVLNSLVRQGVVDREPKHKGRFYLRK